MAANTYFRTFVLGSANWVQLAAGSTVLRVTLTAPAQNSDPVNVRFRGGTPAQWPPGAAATLEAVDLAELEVQGPANHVLTVTGRAVPRHAGYSLRAAPQGGSQTNGGGGGGGAESGG